MKRGTTLVVRGGINSLSSLLFFSIKFWANKKFESSLVNKEKWKGGNDERIIFPSLRERIFLSFFYI